MSRVCGLPLFRNARILKVPVVRWDRTVVSVFSGKLTAGCLIVLNWAGSRGVPLRGLCDVADVRAFGSCCAAGGRLSPGW